MKKHLIAALLLLPAALLAQAPNALEPDRIVARPALWRLSAERLSLPGGESLGLIGASYLMQIAPASLPYLYGGPAVYGAVSGRRGGLLTFGGELAGQLPIAGPWSLGAGVFAGGGGGGGEGGEGGGIGGGGAVGDGWMVRPHAELLWAFRPGQQLGLGWSQVRFQSSRVDSSQVALTWQVSTDFLYVPQGRTLKFQDLGIQPTQRTGIGFDRVQATAGVYRPDSRARTLSGAALPRNIGYAGARLERSLADNLYWGLEANGAASGGVAGYAELLGTVGYEVVTDDESFAAGYRLALGSASGGNVDTGGGLLGKMGLYGIARLANDLGLTLEAGLARAPQGSFRARYASLALNWIIDDRLDGTAPPRVTPMEWVGGLVQYKATRKDGSERGLELAKLRVNRELAPGFYLGAEAQGAVSGGAGGYSVGLLGVGLRHRFDEHWHAGIEAMGGVAGGGNVDAAGGAIVQPMAYVGFDLMPGLALRASAGRVRSLRGPLSSEVVDVSLVFGFGVASRGYR